MILLNSDTYLRDSISRRGIRIKQQSSAGVVGLQGNPYRMELSSILPGVFRSISWELLDLFRFIPLLMPYKKKIPDLLRFFVTMRITICDWLNGAFFFSKKY